MRDRKTSQGLTVQAIAGTYVVLLGLNLKREQCDGLLGFAIHRTDHTEQEAYWLEGMKTFEATDPGFVPGSKYPTNQHPIQGFTWSDFSAKPEHRYIYRIQALRGTTQSLKKFKEVAVDVQTESEETGNHDVYFNRGAAASQEYTRRFGNRRPDETNPNDKRWAWLSRGAMEAIEAFTARAKNQSWGLRVAAYEFRLRNSPTHSRRRINGGLMSGYSSMHAITRRKQTARCSRAMRIGRRPLTPGSVDCR